MATPGDARIDYKLYPLNGENYTIWKAHTKNVLEAKYLLDLVEGAQGDPVRERQARALLTSALSQDNQMKVINCSTANAIWKRLESIYENKSSFEKENLLNKLHSYKIKSAVDISRSVSEKEMIAAKLRLLGESVSDDPLMSAIPRALPKSFKTFITIWKGTAKAERTIESLLTRLMAEVEDEHSVGEKALYSAGNHKRFKGQNFRRGQNRRPVNNPGQGNWNKGGDKEVTCHHCKKPGHFKKDCGQLKQSQGTNSKKQQRSDNKSAKENETNARSFMAVQGDISTWISDSGASVHICPIFKWMSDYEEFDRPIDIGLGNQSTMQAYGAGNILTDTGTLVNVYYAPEASKNLFSESAAAKRGIQNLTNADRKLFMDHKGSVLFEAHACNGLYVINFEVQPTGEKGMKAATIDECVKFQGELNTKTDVYVLYPRIRLIYSRF